MNYLDQLIAEIDRCKIEVINTFELADNEKAVEELGVKFLGCRDGYLTEVQKLLGCLSFNEKPVAGRIFDNFKKEVANAFEAAQERVAK
jgi:phenylalanyl-tRNA synthetase alpha subunit